MNIEALAAKKANIETAEQGEQKLRGGKQPRKQVGTSLKYADFDLLEERLKAMGLETVGDLLFTVIEYPETVEALKPYARKHMKYLDATVADKTIALQRRLEVLKRIAPEKFDELMKETIVKASERTSNEN